MSKVKRIKPQAATSLRPWGTNDAASFESLSRIRSTGIDVPHSTSRQVLSKQKPISGSMPMQPDGWRTPTNFQAYVCKMIPTDKFDYYVLGTTTSQHSGSVGYSPPLSNLSTFAGTAGAGHFPRTSPNLVNRAITEALNKLKDGKINVAESLATINQTVQLIGSVATKMLDVYRALHAKQIARQKLWDACRNSYYSHIASGMSRKARRRRMFFKAWGVPQKRPPTDWFRKKAAGQWLELQYGWKPLVSDVVAALGLLDGLPVPTIRAVRHLEEDESLPQPDGNSGSGPYIHSVNGKIRSGVHVRLDAEVTNAGLAQLDSLSLVNPFSLGWELLPYSFVIDWFIPIGNAISALTASFGLNPRGQSVTQFTVAQLDVKWTQYPFDFGTPIHGRIESMSTFREGSSGFSAPAFYFKTPITTATRAATALALLIALR